MRKYCNVKITYKDGTSRDEKERAMSMVTSEGFLVVSGFDDFEVPSRYFFGMRSNEERILKRISKMDSILFCSIEENCRIKL